MIIESENWTSKRRRAKMNAKEIIRKNPKPFFQISIAVFVCDIFFWWLNNRYAPRIDVENATADMILTQFENVLPIALPAVLLINVLFLIVASPIELAASEFFFKAAISPDATLKGASKWATGVYAIKAIVLNIWLIILNIFWTGLLVFLPSVIWCVILFYTQSIAAIFLLVLTALVGGVFSAVRVYMYSAAPFLVATNTKIGARDAVRRSLHLLRGHGWEFFIFNLSFILWDILSVLTFGFAGIYVYPYKRGATAIFLTELGAREYLEVKR